MTIFLTFLRTFWPYIVSAALGFGVAYKLQGFRLASVKQEFSDYKTEQQRLVIEHTLAADRQREKSAKEYAQLERTLQDEIKGNEVYKRCVAAGRCGVRVISNCPVPAVQTSGRPDEVRADSIPATEPDATLANECAATTLMLNRLQAEIEKQRGY